ncbi:MAG: glycosyltransferase [Planctomycetes bacterium]|nr:glycosyltransferase [Planctomycetota bacterium]
MSNVIVTNRPFEPRDWPADVEVEEVRGPSIPLRRVPLLGPVLDLTANAVAALKLLRASRRAGAAAVVSLGRRSGWLLCFVRSWLPDRGTVVAYMALFGENPSCPRLSRWLTRRVGLGADVVVVFSRSQIDAYHRAFGIPREKLVFVPYKANHSRSPSPELPEGGFIFSGGNSERDYATLFAAVDGLPVAVVVSRTDHSLTRGLRTPENVLVLCAQEPAYERLMAMSRFVVICIRRGVCRGAGEASFLNAMWHGKAVVAADDVSAADYIGEGIDGYTVPAGDAAALRRRILELWNDPVRARAMGEAGRAKVEAGLTHRAFEQRLLNLAVHAAAQHPHGDAPSARLAEGATP